MIELALAFALAGQDYTTTCRTIGNVERCTTTAQGGGYSNYNAARESAQALPPQQYALPILRDEPAPLVRDSRATYAAKVETMLLLRQNDCAGALFRSIETRDTDFMNQVIAACPPPPRE